jgi:hypothetical protein
VDEYDYRNCVSLFGYAAEVHRRSGGVCQLCDAGAMALDFDLWRQMTVEHLIGESQGGYLKQVKAALARRFPGLAAGEIALLAAEIDAVNTVTACSFCNSATSRDHARVSMTELIETAPDGPRDQVLRHVSAALAGILARKRHAVRRKLASVRAAFDSQVAPALEESRLLPAAVPVAAAATDVELIVDRITSDVATSVGWIVTPPGYAHLPLALIDAVYSIRSRYSAVQRVVAAYCKATGISDAALTGRSSPGFREHGLDQFLLAVGSLTGADLASQLFGGSRSRSAGFLKADLCIAVARRLQAESVTEIGHLRQCAGEEAVRRAWTGVHGLGWVTWQYFCSLAGIEHLKPDVMLMRFVACTLGRNVGPAETDALLTFAFERLAASWPGLTKRALDHTIWLFERDR